MNKICKGGPDSHGFPQITTKIAAARGPLFSYSQAATFLQLVWLASLTAFSASCHKPSELITKMTVLKVNDDQVTAQEFAQSLARRMRAYDSLTVKDPSILKRAKEDTVQTYVIEFVTRRYAKETGLAIKSEELKEEIEKRRKSFPDDFAFRRSLADENLSFDDWKKSIESTLLQKKVMENITQVVRPPSEDDVKAYYQANPAQFFRASRVKLRQIVLEKEEDAKRIYEHLAKGGNRLGELAKKYSVAPEGANNGETDWIDKGILDVFDQAFKMPVGTRSKILRSPYGWHIYDVLKKEPETRVSLKEAQAKIKTRIIEERKEAAFSTWLEEQVRLSKVFRNESLLNSISVSTKSAPPNS